MKYTTYEERRQLNATFWHPIEHYWLMLNRPLLGNVRWLFQFFSTNQRRELIVTPYIKVVLPFERLRKQDYAGLYFGLTVWCWHINIGLFVQHGTPDY